MSRIISGLAGSIRLASAATGTRPTSDRVKESVFGALEAMDAIEDAQVLDLFAGTLALGLEALSRGAAGLVGVEKHRNALEICLRNATLVASALNGAGRKPPMEMKLTDSFSYLKSTPRKFDLIFADPPYNLALDQVELLVELCSVALNPGGVFVLEQSGSIKDVAAPDNLELVKRREYGDTAVFFFRSNAQ